MANRVSRFFRPTPTQYTTQFVQEQVPFQEMMGLMQMKESQYQNVLAGAQALGEQFALPARPKRMKQAEEFTTGFQEKLDPIIENLQKTGNIQEATRELTALNKMWQRSTERRGIEGEYEAYMADLEKERELKRIHPGILPTKRFEREWEELTPEQQEVTFYKPERVFEYVDAYKELIEPAIDDMKLLGPEEKREITRERIFNQFGLNEAGEVIDEPLVQRKLGTPAGQQITAIAEWEGTDRIDAYVDLVEQGAREYEQSVVKVPEKEEISVKEEERLRKSAIYMGWGVGKDIRAVINKSQNEITSVSTVPRTEEGELIRDKEGEVIYSIAGMTEKKRKRKGYREPEKDDLVAYDIFSIGTAGIREGAAGANIRMDVSSPFIWELDFIDVRQKGGRSMDFTLYDVRSWDTLKEDVKEMDLKKGQPMRESVSNYLIENNILKDPTEKRFFAIGILDEGEEAERVIAIPYDQIKSDIKKRTTDTGVAGGGFYIDEDTFYEEEIIEAPTFFQEKK